MTGEPIPVGQGEHGLLTPAVAEAVGEARDGPPPARLSTRSLGPCVGVALAGDGVAAIVHADGATGDVAAEVGAGVDRVRAVADGPVVDAWLVTNRPGYSPFDGSEASAAVEALAERGLDPETRVGTERVRGGSTLAVGLDGHIDQPERPPVRGQADARVTDRLDPGAPALRDRVEQILGGDDPDVPTLGPVAVDRALGAPSGADRGRDGGGEGRRDGSASDRDRR